MPDIDLNQFALPYKKEFLLELTNNNYSKETTDNYSRDLTFFEAFMWSEGLAFTKVDKLAISRYKGFLRDGGHILTAHRYLDAKLAAKQQEFQKENNLQDLDGRAAKIAELEAKLKEEMAAEEAAKNKLAASLAKDEKAKTKKSYTKAPGLAARSVNRLLSSLRGYLKFMINIDQAIPIPPDAVKMLKAERKESQVAELDDLIKLIECPEELETKPAVRARNRAILELMFSSGMRISEIVSINREQLNLYQKTGADNIAGKLYIIGKGKKSRFVYLTERCKFWLERYLEMRHDDYPAVFIPYRGGRAGTNDPNQVRISMNYIQERIVKYRRQLGIVVPTSAHSLRHGFATYLAEQGASPAAIQRLLGHESLQTTTRYVHTSDKFAETTHKQFHPLQENKGETEKGSKDLEA